MSSTNNNQDTFDTTPNKLQVTTAIAEPVTPKAIGKNHNQQQLLSTPKIKAHKISQQHFFKFIHYESVYVYICVL